MLNVQVAVAESPDKKQRLVMLSVASETGELAVRTVLPAEGARAIAAQLMLMADEAESRIVKPGPGPVPAGRIREC